MEGYLRKVENTALFFLFCGEVAGLDFVIMYRNSCKRIL
jgi:hypothetical protein